MAEDIKKIDIFYYAKLNGIPIYFQPENNEVIPRNFVCKLILDIQEFLGFTGFEIKLYHKTITRKEISRKIV